MQSAEFALQSRRMQRRHFSPLMPGSVIDGLEIPGAETAAEAIERVRLLHSPLRVSQGVTRELFRGRIHAIDIPSLAGEQPVNQGFGWSLRVCDVVDVSRLGLWQPG